MKSNLTSQDISMYIEYRPLFSSLKRKMKDDSLQQFHASTISFPHNGLSNGFYNYSIDESLIHLRPMCDLVHPMTHPDINNGEQFTPLKYLFNTHIGPHIKNMWGAPAEITREHITKIDTFPNSLYFSANQDGHVFFWAEDRKTFILFNITTSSYMIIPNIIDIIKDLNRFFFDYNNLINDNKAIPIQRMVIEITEEKEVDLSDKLKSILANERLYIDWFKKQLPIDNDVILKIIDKVCKEMS